MGTNKRTKPNISKIQTYTKNDFNQRRINKNINKKSKKTRRNENDNGRNLN